MFKDIPIVYYTNPFVNTFYAKSYQADVKSYQQDKFGKFKSYYIHKV